MPYDVNVLEQMIADRANKSNNLRDNLINSVTNMQAQTEPYRALGNYAKFFTDRPGVNNVDVTGQYPTQQQDQVVKASMAGQLGNDNGLEDIYKTKMATMAAIAKAKNGGAKDYRNMFQDFTRDAQVKERLGEMDAVSKIRGMQDLNNEVVKPVLSRAMLRLSGERGGRFTDQDVLQFGGSRNLADRVDQIVQDLSTGNFTESNLGYYKEMMQVLQRASAASLENQINGFAKIAPMAYGVDPDEANTALRYRIGAQETIKKPGETTQAQTNQPGQTVMTREQMIANIKSKMGK